MARMAMVVRSATWLLCAAALLVGVPARGTAQPSASAPACRDAPRCVDLLEDGIDLIEAGRWEAASILLQAVAAGLEGRPPYARDLARAYVYLGVARLQVADADETRQLFAEAQTRDPTLELGPAEFPRDVLEIWAEARELGGLLVESEPAGAQVSVDGMVRGRSPVGVAGLKPGEYRVSLTRDGYVGASRLLTVTTGRTERLMVPLMPVPAGRSFGEAAVAGAPVDVPTTASRFSADTTKKMGRSMWRTLIGGVAVAAGAAVIGVRGCTVVGAGPNSREGGTPVQMRDGTINVAGFRSWNQRGGCRMEYGWHYRSDALGDRIYGAVEDHELLKSGDRSALSIDPGFSGISTPGFDASSFEERLPDALVQSVGAVHSSRIPVSHLIGGLALAGVGALLATIWSDGGVVVEEVAVSVTPTGGVLASRSFGW